MAWLHRGSWWMSWKGTSKNLKGQRNLLNNVLADTMEVHREEGAKEHCLFWHMNDQCIPLQWLSSERSDQEWQVFTPLCWHSVCLTNTFFLFTPSPSFLSLSSLSLFVICFLFCKYTSIGLFCFCVGKPHRPTEQCQSSYILLTRRIKHGKAWHSPQAHAGVVPLSSITDTHLDNMFVLHTRHISALWQVKWVNITYGTVSRVHVEDRELQASFLTHSLSLRLGHRRTCTLRVAQKIPKASRLTT